LSIWYTAKWQFICGCYRRSAEHAKAELVIFPILAPFRTVQFLLRETPDTFKEERVVHKNTVYPLFESVEKANGSSGLAQRNLA